ncbi:hypothetical protein BJ165DRAFT_1510362 [Panaeolus papilionaceus]|nr:hypothetical protein BJ165DRAFT_1510362 [Panaeolus papilionaceus]
MSRDATVSISVGTAVGGVVASAGLAALAPVVGVGILVAGFAAIGYSIASGLGRRLSSRKEKEEEIDRLKEEEEELANEREELEKSLKQLLTLDTTFDRLTGRLSALQGIWRMLITDAQRLEYSLKDLDEEEDDLLAKTMAGNLEPTYRALMDGLEEYSLATRKFKKD